MKIKSSLILLLLAASGAFAQAPDCDCAAEFRLMKQKVETNYSGFNDKINLKTRKSYDSLSNHLLKLAPSASKPTYCLFLLKQYTDFFNDGNLRIERLPNENDRPFEALVREARKEPIPVPLSQKKITYLKVSTTPEGIYWSPDKKMRIAVTENVNAFRNYVAQVMVSNSNSWRRGDILMELQFDSATNIMKGFQYTETGLIEPVKMDFNVSYLGNWRREFIYADEGRQMAEKVALPATSGKKLSDKTYYLRIASFEAGEAHVIDSVMQASKQAMAACPNLILDLRGNAGGTEPTFAPVSPLLYTDSMRVIGADVWATTDNIKSWSDLLNTRLPEDTKKQIQAVVDTMTKNKGKMIPLAKDYWKKVTVAGPVPKKIVVLMDHGCAGTTEEFLLEARQSKKTKLMGMHSAGNLDYANARSVKFKSIPFMLSYPTSRSRRIDKGQGIDNKGIAPAVLLTDTQDWIATAQQQLESL
ncbi:MAG: hypothetical protein JO154_23545 [Chitinophaga sp.]|uniref:S41 family peptidase n=1 Tax=Chitinophaga sp. TaxID=1869181 RepID=UPI0025B959C4|nr:S41 family peptidase [Chitinophaga sp.]MBV8255589.1 hypothetical protein [Chitinophaga sp.]